MTESLPALAAKPVSRYLETMGPLPSSVISLIEAGATRLLDSDMIITQDRRPPPDFRPGEGAFSELRHEQAEVAEALLGKIAAEGIADYFKPFMGLSVRIMFGLLLTREQQERARDCIDAGHQFVFMMSDAGGPTIAGWRTFAHAESLAPRPEGASEGGTERNGIRLTIDKVWSIEAHRVGMAVVAARLPGVLVPAAYLIWPEQYRTLQRKPHGDPFLEGRLQLGNVKGEVMVAREDRLKLGGPAVFNKYFTLVRPFFVRSLMAHVSWLASRGRVTLDAQHATVHAYLTEIARAQTRIERYDFDNVQRVLAIKFTSNEFLVDLVRKGAVRDFGDQRDLLAFSKMEGSSYHAYHALRASVK